MVPPVPPIQPVIPGPVPALNRFYIKPEFAGKLDEDAETHLLRTNDWLTHMHFKKVSKSKGF